MYACVYNICAEVKGQLRELVLSYFTWTLGTEFRSQGWQSKYLYSLRHLVSAQFLGLIHRFWSFFFYIYCMYVCLHECGDQRQLVGVFSLQHVGPGYGTQVLELGNRSLNQLRHLSGLTPHPPLHTPASQLLSF